MAKWIKLEHACGPGEPEGGSFYVPSLLLGFRRRYDPSGKGWSANCAVCGAQWEWQAKQWVRL